MKAAAYARYSSDNQRDESIDAQIRAIREYCENHKIEIVKIYTDEALSATSDKRPSFLQMIEDSRKKVFDAVIIHKLDRFSRNRYDSAIYKKKLKDNGVKLFSVLENLDDSPESIILESVLEGMAEYYSKNLSREVMKGMKETALQAKHNGGKPPYGFIVNPDKTYSINELEAEVVKTIFDLYLSGYGYTNIAHALSNRGIVTGNARLFTKISIRDILLNEKYIGTYVFNRRADGKTLNKLKPDEEIIRIENAMPAIIDKNVFMKAQEILMGNKRGPKIRKEYYLLTGKLFCGMCGSAYTGSGYVKGRDKETKYYQYSCVARKKNKSCSNKPIRKDVVEDYVIQGLKDKIFNTESMEVLSKKLFVMIKEHNTTYKYELEKTKSEIAELETMSSKAFDLFFKGTINETLLAKKTEEIKSQLDVLNEKLIYMETKDFTWIDEKKIINYLQESKKMLESEDKERQRKVIDAFVDKVLVFEDGIEVDFIVKSPTDSSVRDRVNGGEPYLTITLTTTREDIYK